MEWQQVGEFSLTQDWVLTPEVSEGLFRVTHSSIQSFSKLYLKAVISPVFVDETISLYEPKRLTYREEPELFYFSFPNLIHSKKLGLKRLDKTDSQWIIGLEFMPLYSTLTITKKNLKEDSKTIALTSQAVEVVAANPNRRCLSLFNDTNNIVTLGLGLNSNQIAKILARIPANSVYELPICGDGSIYCGAIYASAKNSGTIYTNEFTEDVAL